VDETVSPGPSRGYDYLQSVLDGLPSISQRRASASSVFDIRSPRPRSHFALSGHQTIRATRPAPSNVVSGDYPQTRSKTKMAAYFARPTTSIGILGSPSTTSVSIALSTSGALSASTSGSAALLTGRPTYTQSPSFLQPGDTTAVSNFQYPVPLQHSQGPTRSERREFAHVAYPPITTVPVASALPTFSSAPSANMGCMFPSRQASVAQSAAYTSSMPVFHTYSVPLSAPPVHPVGNPDWQSSSSAFNSFLTSTGSIHDIRQPEPYLMGSAPYGLPAAANTQLQVP